MSAKKTKLLESAQKNFLKGLYDKAIMEYRQIIQLDPADIRHRQRLAEILTKANQKDEAIKEYTSLAKYYIDSVHYLKAIAVYKQIQKLDPSNPDVSLTLASLNEKQGLIGNATSEYASAVRIYESNGENLKALKALELMIAIDPGNYAVRLRFAEKCFSTGSEERAFNEFVAIGRDLQARNDENGFMHVSEKIRQLFKEKAAEIFASIDECEKAAVKIDESSPAALQSSSQQLPVEPPSFQDEKPAVVVAPPAEISVPVSVDQDEVEVIEDIQPLEEHDEIEEGDFISFAADEADWEEEIDLDALAAGAIATPAYSADTDKVISFLPDHEQEEIEELDELEELEFELEIEDERSDSVLTSADNLTLQEQPLPITVDDSFDLGKELSVFANEIDFNFLRVESGDSRLDLESASGFKRNELDNEDAESHYSLGLAYREMGLFDEAIGEFAVASHAAERKVDCLILQGVCFRECGEVGKAVEILTGTLKLPELDEDKMLGIKYELAACHEAIDEKKEAKQLYSEIMAIRPDFSDTAERLSQL